MLKRKSKILLLLLLALVVSSCASFKSPIDSTKDKSLTESINASLICAGDYTVVDGVVSDSVLAEINSLINAGAEKNQYMDQLKEYVGCRVIVKNSSGLDREILTNSQALAKRVIVKDLLDKLTK